MRTILLSIDGDDGLAARMQAAFDLVRAFGGHLTCLQVTPYAAYAVGEPALGAFPVTALIDAIEAQRHEQHVAVEARIEAEGVSWDWISRDGDSADRIAEAARLADIIVMDAGPFASLAGPRLALTGAVATAGPAPVLAVPAASRGIAVAGAALVAWDGSQEAAVAMRAALPMRRLAETVDILTVDEKPSDFPARAAAAWLARHGIVAELIERGDGGAAVETVIRATIAERRSAWLVMRAYGHSRLRETIFGGVTRGLLADAPVPLVLAH